MLRNDELKLRIFQVLRKHKALSINRLKRETGVVNYDGVKSALEFLTHEDIDRITIKDANDRRGTRLVSLKD